MTDKQVYDLTKYLFESWERGADYDNYHTDSMCVLETLAQPERPWVGLTHKEMYDVIRPLCSADEMATWLLEISEDEYLAIEAKLKEKNT